MGDSVRGISTYERARRIVDDDVASALNRSGGGWRIVAWYG